MNFKILRPIAAALVVASLAPVVNAEILRDHATDAQTQAATLLNPPVAIGTSIHSSPVDPPGDAQASAAALLSGTGNPFALRETHRSDERATGDAQAQAAAVLAGSSTRAESGRTQASSSAVGY